MTPPPKYAVRLTFQLLRSSDLVYPLCSVTPLTHRRLPVTARQTQLTDDFREPRTDRPRDIFREVAPSAGSARRGTDKSRPPNLAQICCLPMRDESWVYALADKWGHATICCGMPAREVKGRSQNIDVCHSTEFRPK